MANQNLDEDLIARNADAENSQQTEQEPTEEEINESLRLQELDELRQSQRLATQRSAAQRIQSVQQTAQTALKWYKRYSKTVLVIEFLAATFPIWGTLLLALLILVGFVGGCNSSTSFRIASLGSCEPFIL